MTRAPDVLTFGCRLNAYESEVLRLNAEAAEAGDVVIVNTCAVTAEAVRQAQQAIRKARRERPEARILVTGCAAQIEPERFAAMPEVTRVIGNAKKLAPDFATPRAERVAVDDIMTSVDRPSPVLAGFAERARAFVQIQNGCDHRCTFCTIPYGRGPSRSMSGDVVVNQVRTLVERGVAEIALTGVDLTAYGADLPGLPTLGDLVQKILADVPELARLRLSSIDSVEADDTLLRLITEDERVMPHLHLSLQAGDDMILKRMKRRHSRADAIAFCERLRRARPEIVFGADLIAGFPTETDEMFENSLSLIEACGLVYTHVFPFSPRPGTPAARMPQLNGAVVRERARRLRERGASALAGFLARQVGTTTNALVEGHGRARTDAYAPVRFRGEARIGAVIPLHITGAETDHLVGAVAT